MKTYQFSLPFLLIFLLAACGGGTNLPSTGTSLPILTDPATPTPLLTATPTAASLPESDLQKDYEPGAQAIADWVSAWMNMGALTQQEIGGPGNSLAKVPLPGSGANVVCVDTKGKGNYAGQLLCPPLDLANGGLRQLPAEGQEDSVRDRPLFITIGSNEVLTTVGERNQLVYQVVDKNTVKALRYVDPKTGKMTEGEYEPVDDSAEWERVEQNVEMFINMPEREYRDWVNQNAFIPSQTYNESTYIFPIGIDGHSLAEKMGVRDRTLGLMQVGTSEYRSGDSLIGTSLHSSWQGIYLGGRQVNYDAETRVTISFFGVEIGGNRVVLPVVTGYEGINDASFTSIAMTSSSRSTTYVHGSLQSELVSFDQLQGKLAENEGKIVVFGLIYGSSDSQIRWMHTHITPLNKCFNALLYTDGGEIRNGNLTQLFLDYYGRNIIAEKIAEVIPDISSNENYFVSDFVSFNFLNGGATFSLGK
ncbi:MAG: hypothetical protein L6300_07510 [Syntrophaceae bacterium]|nr:hypothetical protein [Syntrophaceae bacterium]